VSKNKWDSTWSPLCYRRKISKIPHNPLQNSYQILNGQNCPRIQQEKFRNSVETMYNSLHSLLNMHLYYMNSGPNIPKMQQFWHNVLIPTVLQIVLQFWNDSHAKVRMFQKWGKRGCTGYFTFLLSFFPSFLKPQQSPNMKPRMCSCNTVSKASSVSRMLRVLIRLLTLALLSYSLIILVVPPLNLHWRASRCSTPSTPLIQQRISFFPPREPA